MNIEEFGAYKGAPPLLGVGRVDGYDSESHSVYVRLLSWQMPFPARVLINGDCDGVRINQQPLPIRGTWGLIAFPMGDYRNAIWLGSFVNGTSTSSNAQSTDSINSSNTDIDSQMRYYSHFSGFYDLLDSVGNYFSRYPDGTIFLVNSDDKEPTTYRHVVDNAGARQRVVFDDSYRTPNPPDPFYVSVQHPTGTSETITPQGIISKKTGNQPPDHPDTGPILELNPLKSNVTAPLGTPAGGAQLIGQAGNSDIFMDKDGNVQIISNGNDTTILMSATGDVSINASGSTTMSANVNSFVSAGNALFIDAGGNVSITSGLEAAITGVGVRLLSTTDLVQIISASIIQIFSGQGGILFSTPAFPVPQNYNKILNFLISLGYSYP